MAPNTTPRRAAAEGTAHTQLPHTQIAYGTQMAQPTRPRTAEDDPEVVGVKRLEPVLAGATQRKDLRPTAAVNTHATLLGLLNQSGVGRPSHAPVVAPSVPAALEKPQNFPEQTSPKTPSRPAATEGQRQTLSVTKTPQTNAEASGSRHGKTPQTSREASVPRHVKTPQTSTDSSVPRRSKKSAAGARPLSPTIADSVDKTVVVTDLTEEDEPPVTASPALECAWMRGFVFNSEALVPDTMQQNLLRNDLSWYQSHPGVPPFPLNNVPILLFDRICAIVDQKVAAEGPSQTDSEDEVDPSPDSVDITVDQSPDPIIHLTQDEEPPTSQLSWSASPSPEPPQKPEVLLRGLPPDSSLETSVAPANRTPQIQPQVVIESSNEKESSLPRSSLRLAEQPVDSDEEMEMEISVPLALGEDIIGIARPPEPSRARLSSESPKHHTVVQVRETPYAKKNNEFSVKLENTTPKPKQGSSGNTKSSTLTSIVYGTYNEPASKSPAQNKAPQDHTVDAASVIVEDFTTSAVDVVAQTEQPASEPSEIAGSEDVSMLDSPSFLADQSKQHSPASLTKPKFQLPPDEEMISPQHQPTPASIKHKLVESPTKNSRRPSKRREIKIVGFGNDSPSSVDPALVLRQDRAESFRKFKEERRRSTSTVSTGVEGQSESASKSDNRGVETMDVDVFVTPSSDAPSPAMSPRHRSLYEEPASPATHSSVAALQGPLTAAQQPPIVNKLQPADVQSARSVKPAALPVAPPTLTVFQTFKATYPRYSGDVKHFRGQCKQMYTLDQQDKMVPKWQWDDFIIRNRTDYKDYASECVDNGNDPEPYHRFYKDTIRDTLYNKGVIESRQTLLQALKELDVDPSSLESSQKRAKSPRKNKHSRTSLPGAVSQYKKPSNDRNDGTSHSRPRHSLPGSTSTHHPLPTRPPSSSTSCPPQQLAPKHTNAQKASSSDLLARLHSDPTPRVSSASTESTGDPFRDYYFAQQRLTSVTGSKKVSPRQNGNGGRKS